MVGDFQKRYLEEVQATLGQMPLEALKRATALLQEARLKGRRVYVLGNGGSAATASHFASDLMKGASVPGWPRFRAFALTDNMPVFSAWANDASYEEVFAQQLENFLEAEDVVVAISGSGNSPNVLRAVELARSRGAVTMGISGFKGGKLKGMVDVAMVVPNHLMEQVEDIHLLVCHLLSTSLRWELEQRGPKGGG